jgi:NarL family two-component system sensor histidine kinase LiaS
LYRIAQEALNNTLKHAYAHTVKVTLTETDTHIILEIVDDGVGFDPDNAFKISQMGLAGMQSHAAELGGTLSIVSAPGTGSKIKVVIKQC